MDLFGAISGVVAGAAFAPFNQKATAQYVVQGATGGVLRPWKTVSSGIGASVGYAALGNEGLKEGAMGGIGAIPHMFGKSVQAIPKEVAKKVIIPSALIIGGVIVVFGLLSSGSLSSEG